MEKVGLPLASVAAAVCPLDRAIPFPHVVTKLAEECVTARITARSHARKQGACELKASVRCDKVRHGRCIRKSHSVQVSQCSGAASTRCVVLEFSSYMVVANVGVSDGHPKCVHALAICWAGPR
eukprot:6211433-Pleurochrysis_carterae.AAC.1